MIPFFRAAGVAALAAALLPAFLLLFEAPLTAADPAAFAALHTAPAFGARVALTLLYFPLAIAAHAGLVAALSGNARLFALLGLVFFALGNGVDMLYRCLQFFWLNYGLGARMLSEPAAAAAIWTEVTAFAGAAPAYTTAFAIFFACGRLLIAGAALAQRSGMLLLVVGALLAATGLQNLLSVVAGPLGWSALAAISAGLYVPIWLAGLVALGAFLLTCRVRA